MLDQVGANMGLRAYSPLCYGCMCARAGPGASTPRALMFAFGVFSFCGELKPKGCARRVGRQEA